MQGWRDRPVRLLHRLKLVLGETNMRVGVAGWFAQLRPENPGSKKAKVARAGAGAYKEAMRGER